MSVGARLLFTEGVGRGAARLPFDRGAQAQAEESRAVRCTGLHSSNHAFLNSTINLSSYNYIILSRHTACQLHPWSQSRTRTPRWASTSCVSANPTFGARSSCSPSWTRFDRKEGLQGMQAELILLQMLVTMMIW